jgi:spore coat polysaccharide biosynthesis predicted glycosyltransferase SpsG
MHRADLAVSTASSTTYELLAVGTPIVCLPVADNQRPIAGALQKRDAATVLNRGADETAFRRGIRRYVDSPQLRRRRRERGRELVDGRGVKRIHAELLSLVDDQSSA